MSRYIKADKVLMALRLDHKDVIYIDKNDTARRIEKIPNIDIVRCKECRWRKQDKSCDLNCRIEYLDGTETDMWFYTEDDDYCSYGERKADD